MCRVAKYEMVAERVQGYNSDVIDKRMNSADNIARFIMESLKSDRKKNSLSLRRITQSLFSQKIKKR